MPLAVGGGSYLNDLGRKMRRAQTLALELDVDCLGS